MKACAACQILIHFTLYSRSYCHLCDDMLAALRAYSAQHAFTVEVLDVDANEALLEQYDELVPVLLAGKDNAAPRHLCHYFMDIAKLEAFFADAEHAADS